jgi:hypothetical protein
VHRSRPCSRLPHTARSLHKSRLERAAREARDEPEPPPAPAAAMRPRLVGAWQLGAPCAIDGSGFRSWRLLLRRAAAVGERATGPGSRVGTERSGAEPSRGGWARLLGRGDEARRRGVRVQWVGGLFGRGFSEKMGDSRRDSARREGRSGSLAARPAGEGDGHAAGAGGSGGARVSPSHGVGRHRPAHPSPAETRVRTRRGAACRVREQRDRCGRTPRR